MLPPLYLITVYHILNLNVNTKYIQIPLFYQTYSQNDFNIKHCIWIHDLIDIFFNFQLNQVHTHVVCVKQPLTNLDRWIRAYHYYLVWGTMTPGVEQTLLVFATPVMSRHRKGNTAIALSQPVHQQRGVIKVDYGTCPVNGQIWRRIFENQ